MTCGMFWIKYIQEIYTRETEYEKKDTFMDICTFMDDCYIYPVTSAC